MSFSCGSSRNVSAKRIGIPRLHGVEAQDPRRVGAAAGAESESVSLHPEYHRREERVGRRECAAREVGAAESLQAVAPQRIDAGDVPVECGRHLLEASPAARSSSSSGCAAPRNPNAFRPPRCAPRRAPPFPAARRRGRSPRYSAMASESQTTIAPSTRQGTLPLGEIFLKPVPRRRVAEAHQPLFEPDPELAHQHPGPKRPGRVVLVGDIKFEHRSDSPSRSADGQSCATGLNEGTMRVK